MLCLQQSVIKHFHFHPSFHCIYGYVQLSSTCRVWASTSNDCVPLWAFLEHCFIFVYLLWVFSHTNHNFWSVLIHSNRGQWLRHRYLLPSSVSAMNHMCWEKGLSTACEPMPSDWLIQPVMYVLLTIVCLWMRWDGWLTNTSAFSE